jgi:hexosaminidase
MTIIDYPMMAPKPAAAMSARIKTLDVTVTSKISSLALGVDESYVLDVNGGTATLQAPTIFGALRGLESFAQMVQWNGTAMVIPYTPIHINDAPAWPWRGMLVDTARHYQSLKSLEAIIDSMVYSKLNVFHWHLTDAESFPIVLPSAPEFSQKGAWSKKAIYTKKDVDHIIKYALYRGIRVIPEIDTPGHTYAMGHAYPDMITNCTNVIGKSALFPQINSVALNIPNDNIYPLLDKIYGDLATMFSDDFLHVGGDEVRPSCWDQFPWIKEWMGAQGMDNSTYLPLLRYFRTKLSPMILNRNKKMVVWQEALEEMMELGSANPLSPSNTVVQIWINDNYQQVVNKFLTAGYPTLLSGGWYLDQQVPRPNPYVPGTDQSFMYSNATHYGFVDTWQDMYQINPFGGLNLTPQQAALFIGGEVAQWAEAVMGSGILTNVWPRAAAAAERLWIGTRNVTDYQPAFHRLMRFQCYLYQRGVPTGALRPSYCHSAVFDPPFVAGGHTIQMPVWALIILIAFIVILIVVLIALGVKLYKMNQKEKKSQFESINGDDQDE